MTTSTGKKTVYSVEEYTWRVPKDLKGKFIVRLADQPSGFPLVTKPATVTTE